MTHTASEFTSRQMVDGRQQNTPTDRRRLTFGFCGDILRVYTCTLHLSLSLLTKGTEPNTPLEKGGVEMHKQVKGKRTAGVLRLTEYMLREGIYLILTNIFMKKFLVLILNADFLTS